jgi:predicted N-acetyltransferase YhbS
VKSTVADLRLKIAQATTAAPQVEVLKKAKPSTSLRANTPHVLPLVRRKTLPEHEVQIGRAGDHAEVQQLLLHVLHAPSRDEFHAWSEKPGYDPSQRLLIKRGNRPVAHLLTTDVPLRFGAETLAAKQLHWLATLPEYRGQGMAAALLHGADRRMQNDGTALGVLRTSNPRLFENHGWTALASATPRPHRARDILAQLTRRNGNRPQPLSVRCWRHVELPSLMRIYNQTIGHAYGPLARTEDDWRWLISRKGFDHILVAIHGRDRFDLTDERAPIVGYAVMRGRRVVEFATNPEYPTADEQLLARACGEMIEHDRQELSLCIPPSSGIQQYLCNPLPPAVNHEPEEWQMVRVPDFGRLLRCLLPELQRRLDKADYRGTSELGLAIGTEKHVLSISRAGIKHTADKLGRSYVQLSRDAATRLLLGRLNFNTALDNETVRASTQAAREIGAVLFPTVPWWISQWDELTAI